MGDVVGHLLQGGHQGLDAVEHLVEAEGEIVELVVRALDGEAMGEIAGHQPARRLGHVLYALEDGAPDEKPGDEARHHDDDDGVAGRLEDQRAELADLADVAADQQLEPAGQAVSRRRTIAS